LRTIENAPFEVTETGWGEFEIQIKLYFTPESTEKPQTVWHPLKLHPYGPDAEKIRELGLPVISQSYEEIVFNEPVEAFFEILTSGAAGQAKKNAGSGKAGKHSSIKKEATGYTHTAEVPHRKTATNEFSVETEGEELDRLKIAIKKVDEMMKKEKVKLSEREEALNQLKKTEGLVLPKKK
jgi:YEATS domain-containing protein 4